MNYTVFGGKRKTMEVAFLLPPKKLIVPKSPTTMCDVCADKSCKKELEYVYDVNKVRKMFYVYREKNYLHEKS